MFKIKRLLLISVLVGSLFHSAAQEELPVQENFQSVSIGIIPIRNDNPLNNWYSINYRRFLDQRNRWVLNVGLEGVGLYNIRTATQEINYFRGGVYLSGGYQLWSDRLFYIPLNLRLGVYENFGSVKLYHPNGNLREKYRERYFFVGMGPELGFGFQFFRERRIQMVLETRFSFMYGYSDNSTVYSYPRSYKYCGYGCVQGFRTWHFGGSLVSLGVRF